MSRHVRRRWISDFSAPSRSENRSCEYEAYIPDTLVDRWITLDGDVAADVADAEVAIARLNTEATALVDTEALARVLLRAEAVASSRIEGLEIGARRLLHAEVVRGMHEAASDVTAAEVLNNIDAMTFAVESVSAGDPITVEILLDIHRRLLAGTRLEQYGGIVRDQQNWIGGNSYNPCSAAFVPPPPENVNDLLQDLCAFSCTDDLPAVAQAAIAHAQFETIHPFVDGNGRTGRVLIHIIFRRRGLASNVLPPVSLILATWARDYIDGLTQFRYVGAPTSKSALAGLNTWVGRFAGSCTRAVSDAGDFEKRALEIEQVWRGRVGRIRANSATELLLRALLGAPVVTTNSAAELIGRSFVQTSEAITRLVEAEVLRQVNVGKRNRAFEAPDIIDAFAALERQLATPEGDTLTSEPVRRVLRRRT
ncbi:MAG: Fic family protein [Actinomycetota bacterium]|nr:MAG: Fic family protein [Actinomycetota bacterium]